MATLTDLEILLLALSARLAEVEVHSAIQREMLEGLGVSRAAYDHAFAPRVEAQRRHYAEQMARRLHEEAGRQAQIAQLLRDHEFPHE